MEFIPANAPSLAAFAGILVAVLAAFLWAVRRAFGTAKATGVAAGVLGLWLGLLSLLVATGALTRLPLRGLPQFFSLPGTRRRGCQQSRTRRAVAQGATQVAASAGCG